MADTMRWRYGETNPVVIPVDAATVIEIGDVVYLATDDARPAAQQADQGTEAANQELFHDNFAGVAMQRSASGTALENQVVAAVATPNLAIGRCAKRVNPADTKALVDIVSTVSHGGPQAAA